MIALASIGELTSERYGFFISLLSNQKIGENDVQRHILELSSQRRNNYISWYLSDFSFYLYSISYE